MVVGSGWVFDSDSAPGLHVYLVKLGLVGFWAEVGTSQFRLSIRKARFWVRKDFWFFFFFLFLFTKACTISCHPPTFQRYTMSQNTLDSSVIIFLYFLPSANTTTIRTTWNRCRYRIIL